ncbi:unnamed protein product, partial [Mesorhabditis spiculigera]
MDNPGNGSWNNPENATHCGGSVFTKEQIDLRLIGNMPISVFGMFTNIINIVVFLDVEMRVQLVNHFLLALSLSDLLLLICNFFFLILPVISNMSSRVDLHNAYPVALWYAYPIGLTTQTCGVYLTVLVSVHRYLGVCHPFRAKRWVSGRPVKAAIGGSILFSILINPKFNSVINEVGLTEFQQGYIYRIVAKVIGYTMVMFIIPFAILIIVNCRIIIALQQSKNLRQMHSSKKSTASRTMVMNQFRMLRNSKYTELFNTLSKMTGLQNFRSPSFLKTNSNSVRDRSVTMMLLAIVGIFLFCNCLALCNNLIDILVREQLLTFSNELFEMSVEIANLLISLNSSSSIFVYMIFSSKYRTIIKHWLGLQKRKKVNGVALTTALAAQKALELSVLPDEVENRRRKSNAEKFSQSQGSRQPLSRRTSSHSDIRVEDEICADDDSDARRTSSRRKLLRFATVQ